jgi:hypothetical protein
MLDNIDMDNLGLSPKFKSAVYTLCGLRNNPEMLTTTDKLRVSCVEALRLGYILSKVLDVEKDEFMEGLLAVMEVEDNINQGYH